MYARSLRTGYHTRLEYETRKVAVLVCQRKRVVRRGSGAGPVQGAPERCAPVSEVSSSEVSTRGYIKFVAQKTCVKSSIV